MRSSERTGQAEASRTDNARPRGPGGTRSRCQVQNCNLMSELGTNPLAAGEKNISVDAARAAMRDAIVPIRESEVVPLSDALGRVLAADVISPINVPANDNSAMDGYAFDSAALRPDRELTLRAVGRVVAGQPP